MKSYVLGLFVVIYSLGGVALSADPSPEIALEFTVSNCVWFSPSFERSNNPTSLSELDFKLVDKDGYYLAEDDFKNTDFLRKITDGEGNCLLQKRSHLRVGRSDYFVKGCYKRGFMLRLCELAELKGESPLLSIAGVLPLRRATKLKEITISPLGKLTGNVYEIPGARHKVVRQDNTVCIEHNYPSHPVFRDAAGKEITGFKTYVGEKPGFMAKVYIFENFPEDGSLTFSLPEESESTTYTFSYQNTDVFELVKKVQLEQKDVFDALNKLKARYAGYTSAPLVEGVKYKIDAQLIAHNYEIWMQGNEQGARIKTPRNLSVRFEVFSEQGLKEECKNTKIFMPVEIIDDTGKSLLSDKYRSYCTTSQTNADAELRIFVMLGNLLLPAAEATKISKLSGYFYTSSADKSLKRVFVEMADIPLFYKKPGK